jgi:CheY-like chemotaxis protein
MANVLYVEDSETVLKWSIQFLDGLGHTAKGAANGEEGLEILLNDEKIDLIFTDYGMPIINGYDFCRAVKTGERFAKYSNVPIVGVGGFPPDKREYLVECLRKPFGIEEIKRCVQQYCK